MCAGFAGSFVFRLEDGQPLWHVVVEKMLNDDGKKGQVAARLGTAKGLLIGVKLSWFNRCRKKKITCKESGMLSRRHRRSESVHQTLVLVPGKYCSNMIEILWQPCRNLASSLQFLKLGNELLLKLMDDDTSGDLIATCKIPSLDVPISNLYHGHTPYQFQGARNSCMIFFRIGLSFLSCSNLRRLLVNSKHFLVFGSHLSDMTCGHDMWSSACYASLFQV